jgi:hypothetical protein
MAVQNGDEDGTQRVSSASIEINGMRVAGPADLMEDGAHTLSARVLDQAGNERTASACSSAWSWTTRTPTCVIEVGRRPSPSSGGWPRRCG